jgi:hypothetical protein
MSKKALSRDAFLQALNKVKREEVDVPELGGTVWIYELTGAELDAYGSLTTTREGKPSQANARAKFLTLTLRDENGKRLFDQPGDADRLGQLPGSILNPLFMISRRLSGGDLSDPEKDAEKNSARGQSGETSSD